MKFRWDENKRQINLDKHGLDFKDAHKIFKNITFTEQDHRIDYGEDRYMTMGFLDGVVMLVHTETDDEIRIISMRKATKHEEKIYFSNLNK